MSTVQLRAFVYAVGHIHKKDEELTAVKIPIKALYNGEGGKNYKNVVKLANELQDVKVKILSVVKNKDGLIKREYIGFTIFPTVKHTEDSKYIVTRINPDLKGFFVGLNGDFTQAELKKLMSLKTIQAYRVYMFIKMNIDKSKGKIPSTFKIDYKEFRLMLGLDVLEDAEMPKKTKQKLQDLALFPDQTGVQVEPEKAKVKVLKYAEFDNFKKRILKTAQKELREMGLLDFEFEADKQGGRSVKYVIFKLRPTIALEQPAAEPAVEKRKSDLFSQVFESPELAKVRANAIRIMKEKYGFTDVEIEHFITKLPPSTITMANKWFSAHKGTLNFTSESDWFKSHLQNKIK